MSVPCRLHMRTSLNKSCHFAYDSVRRISVSADYSEVYTDCQCMHLISVYRISVYVVCQCLLATTQCIQAIHVCRLAAYEGCQSLYVDYQCLLAIRYCQCTRDISVVSMEYQSMHVGY